MNKQEYKLLSEEIMTLTANSQFQDAAEIADRIDWRKVRSFSMLMKISELYQLNRRYDDALELMLMAYDHNPKNRDIVYSLVELYILLENHVKALEFLALYKRMAPHDPGVYILQYKFQELEGAAIEDQIQLLEEFTRKDYREEWVYQLAYLYHRMGLATKCVETCDELLNWFREGPFVIKTLELKRLHAKLTPAQQAIYDSREDIAEEIRAVESDEYTAEKADPDLDPDMKDVDIHVKTIDMSKFGTMNLQKALADSMRELMGAENAAKEKNGRITGRIMKPMIEDDYMSTGEMEKQMAGKGAEERNAAAREQYEDGYPEENGGYPEENYEGDYSQEGYEGDYPQEGYEGDYPQEGYEGDYPQEGYEGDYPQEGYEGDYAQEGYEGDYSQEGYEGDYPQESYEGDYAQEGYQGDYPQESYEGDYAQESYEGDYSQESYQGDYSQGAYQGGYPQGAYEGNYSQQGYAGGYSGQTYEEDPIESVPGELASEPEGVEDQTLFFNPVDVSAVSRQTEKKDEVFFEDRTDDIVIDNLPSNTNPEYESVLSKARAVQMEEEEARRSRAVYAGDNVERRSVRSDKSGMENMFYLGDDGQLGLAVPVRSPEEKQITGQIHLSDYLTEWEKTKKRQRAMQDEELHRNLLERTGPIFKDYEEDSRNGLIVELEREQKIFEDKYQADDIELRSIDEISEEIAAEESSVFAAPAVEIPGIAAADPSGPVRSIWDDVHDAMEAEKNTGGETDSDAGTETESDGAIGLVDAAVAGSSSLLETKNYDMMQEITAGDTAGEEEAPAEGAAQEPAAETEQESETAAAEDESSAADESVAAEDSAASGESEEASAVTAAEEDSTLGAAAEEGDGEAYQEESGYGEESRDESGYSEESPDENGEYGDEYYSDDKGYYDEDGYYYPEEGGYYDPEGNYYPEEGGYYDPEGNYYPEEGGYYDPEGNYFPDEDGYGEEEQQLSEAEDNAEGTEDAAGEDGGYADEEPSAEADDTAAGVNWDAGVSTAQLNEISGALEADADRVGHETVDEMNDEFTPDQENELSLEEQKLFADFLYSKKMRTQLLEVIDKISLAAYVGNVIITGDNDENALKLGKNLIKEIQMIDANFVSTRIAKISGTKMNRRDIPMMLNQLSNGALMIDNASQMNRETMETMARTLESMAEGLFVVMIDKRKDMDRLLEEYGMITGYFNARIDIAPMNNNALVDYAKKYAYSKEYKIDEERGVLALHQRISELQIGEHNVTTREVEDIVDEAIEHSRKHRLAAYFQVLSGKRYDYEDMIILREKDFIHK